MVGVIEYETSNSLERNASSYQNGEIPPDSERDFSETRVHFDKRMLGEFYRNETYIVTWINGRRYHILYDEELYEEMCNVHN